MGHDHESRNEEMLRVSAHDLAEAHDVFEMLMGEQVGPRKNFIQSHATEVRNLDV